MRKLLLWCVLFFPVFSSFAQVPNYGSGFSSSGLTLNGGATISGTNLRLTDGGLSEGRSTFFNTPVNIQSFVTNFTFALTNPDPSQMADGFTFCIQGNSPTALGYRGGSLGYGPDGSGLGAIQNSVAVGFQLFSSALGYIEVSLNGMWTNGASPAAAPGTDMSVAAVDLHSGDTFKVTIGYNGTTLSVQIRDMTSDTLTFFQSFPINIPATVGGNTAYVGFTAGTGAWSVTQDILSWSYSGATGSSGTFIWPVDLPLFVFPNDYSTFNGQYHTGTDICPATLGCQRGDPVYATRGGLIVGAFVVPDMAQTMCDGSSSGSLPINNSNPGLGNVLVISHPGGKYSLYAHLDCIWQGLASGVSVSQGQRIGNIGNSRDGLRYNNFTPHLHFEIKDAAVLGDGFAPDLPDGYGYHDPRTFLFPFSPTSISPLAVRITPASSNVLAGPDTSYAFLSSVAMGQEFVASASSGSWYRIYLPNSAGPASGWIPASAGSQILAAPDPTATQIEVTGTGGAGLPIRPSAVAPTTLVSWDGANCSPVAKIWDGQRFVSPSNQSGWYQYYLPANTYFDSASPCQYPGPGPSLGWSPGTSLIIH